MIRLLSHIFGWNYENCKGCEVMRTQLQISNQEKKELTDTLLKLIRPQVFEQPSKEIQHIPTSPAAMSFSRRRSMLEKAARERNQVISQSPFLGRPDGLPNPVKEPITAEALEKELGVISEEQIEAGIEYKGV